MPRQPMPGRSAAHPGDGATRMFTAANEEFQFTAIETAGTWPQAKKNPQWPGEGPNEETQQRNKDAGAALLDRIGPAVVLTHSQSGAFGWLIADARPQFVKAVVALAPLAPPF